MPTSSFEITPQGWRQLIASGSQRHVEAFGDHVHESVLKVQVDRDLWKALPVVGQDPSEPSGGTPDRRGNFQLTAWGYRGLAGCCGCRIEDTDCLAAPLVERAARFGKV